MASEAGWGGRERALTVNQGTAKDLIYGSVTGQEFAMQVRAIADVFKGEHVL